MSSLLEEKFEWARVNLSRRSFLGLGILAAALWTFPAKARAQLAGLLSPERALAFYNTHTGESLKTVYFIQGEYLPEGMAEINHILRDHRTDEIKAIDVRLLDLLYAISTRLEASEPFHIISGYRSPVTNAFLHSRSSGVAEHSLHMEGKAADIRVPGRDLSRLRKVAMGLEAGGVGYYFSSNFVHLDVGRVRFW